jgi:hypothetical protein
VCSFIILFFITSLGFSSCLSLDPPFDALIPLSTTKHFFGNKFGYAGTETNRDNWPVSNSCSYVVLKLSEAHLIFGSNWNFQLSMIRPIKDFGLMSS